MTDRTTERVVVLGASDKPHRYAYMAIQLLQQQGHHVIAINPRPLNLPGIESKTSLSDITGPIDTITLYMSPHRQEQEIDNILRLAPKRIIANPGTESDLHETLFEEHGIAVDRACTLVLLRTGQYC